jgi:hypothetical protein
VRRSSPPMDLGSVSARTRIACLRQMADGLNYVVLSTGVRVRKCFSGTHETMQRPRCRSALEHWVGPHRSTHTAIGAQQSGPAEAIPAQKTISIMYSDQGGWIAALEDAGLWEAPAMTVRAVVENPDQAEEPRGHALRERCVVVHRSNRRWVEVRGTTASVAAAVASAGLGCR